MNKNESQKDAPYWHRGRILQIAGLVFLIFLLATSFTRCLSSDSDNQEREDKTASLANEPHATSDTILEAEKSLLTASGDLLRAVEKNKDESSGKAFKKRDTVRFLMMLPAGTLKDSIGGSCIVKIDLSEMSSDPLALEQRKNEQVDADHSSPRPGEENDRQ